MEALKKSAILNKISFFSFLATLFLLPLFFIPNSAIPLFDAKGFLFSIGMIISFFFWLLGSFIEGKISFPKSALLLSAVFLMLALLVAAVFSPVPKVSFGAIGFDLGSYGLVGMMMLGLFLASVFFQDKKKLSYFYFSTLLSFLILVLFQLSLLISHWDTFLPKGFFSSLIQGNLLGKLNDFAIYLSFLVLSCVSFLELFSPSLAMKIISYAGMAGALVILALVNYLPAWIMLAVFSSIFFAIDLIKGKQKISSRRKASSFPIIFPALIVISVFFMFGGKNLFTNRVIVNSEIRPSAQVTWQIAKETLAKSPIIGSGLNRFLHSWFLFKPALFNTTSFWNASFDSGFGFIPTFLVTSGMLGALAWLSFIGMFLFGAMKYTVSFSAKNNLAQIFFILSSYLWIFAVIYNPSIAVMSLAFVFTGIFIGSLASSKTIKTYELHFLQADPRMSFGIILLLVALIAGSVGTGYAYSKKFISLYHFERANQLISKGASGQVENEIIKAITLDSNDFYYRSLSMFYFQKFTGIASAGDKNQMQELQELLNKSEASAQAAVLFDKTNYSNWLNLAEFYRSSARLGIKGSYESASAAYKEALALNPKNPGLYLEAADLELIHGNILGAQANLSQALKLKPDYKEASDLLSRIVQSEKNPAPKKK